MKILYSWLKEFVPLDIPAEKAADILASLGFEIAGIQRLGGDLSGVVLAEVQDVQKHPNADRLSLCRVSDGQQAFSVVCGASNVRAGIRVPLARIGAVLPNGMKIGPAKLRGVESQGMICSAAELGLEAASDGILIMDSSNPLGTDIKSLLNLDEILIEIEITPNRRDALSVIGVARELAAALNLPLKNPEPRVRELELSNGFAISNEATDLCPRYIGRLIREIRVGPSPDWMVRRLSRCGIRSINNIVDITNYVMLELGQPLHAFDGLKLRGRRLRIRLAREGESLLTLEGKNVKLEPDMLVIADEDKPAAIAGVIGGEPSGITQDTVELVLESAAFEPGTIRRTSRKLGISTESSYRFERGSDWNMVALASTRAAQLIQELAGGLGFKPIESAARSSAPISIKLQTDRVRQLLGLDIKEAVIADILRRLGCVIQMGSGQILVTVPTWRTDLAREADLLEEIARLVGYGNIPSRLPSVHSTPVPESAGWDFERRISGILVGLGLSEAQNFSFVNARQIPFFTPGLGRPADTQPIPLANPLSQEQAFMRPSLLPGLLQNALTNFHHQIPGVSLFEIGRIFDQTNGGPQEVRRLGLLLAGTIQPPHWRQKSRKADFYDLLGLLESFFGALHIRCSERTPGLSAGQAGSHPAFHPKRSATWVLGDQVLGWAGEIHPALAAQLDSKEPMIAAELDMTALLQAAPGSPVFSPLSAFPPVHRDISFVVPDAVPFDKVTKVIRSAAGGTLENCTLIDLYRGASIGAGKKSLTLTLDFRHKERTLKDTEVETAMTRIKTELEKKCEAKIRQ
jgi:phenylalanyl-tRNA synthetase beta chain